MKNFNPQSPALKHSQPSKLRTIASIFALLGALGFSNAALAADASAVQAGSQAAVKQAQNAGLIPPKDIPALFKRLGYDDPTIAAAAEVAKQMEAAGATLEKQNYDVIFGAMVSNSRVDKPKVLKTTSNNPAESFEALFDSNELTLKNYEKVFDALNCKDYKKRVNDLGADTSKAWFGLFNATLLKMPAQNAYLLEEAIKITSTISAYGNPANKRPINAAIVADQTWRWMLMVSDADFNVASLIYGQTLEAAALTRIPSYDALQKVLAGAEIKRPPSLSDIPTRGTNDMVARVAQYLSRVQQGMRIKQNTQEIDTLSQESAHLSQENEQKWQKAEQLGQKAEQLGQKAEQLGQINNLMDTTTKLIDFFNKSLPELIKAPKDKKLIESIQSNIIQLRDIKKQWAELAAVTAEDEYKNGGKYYSMAMDRLERIERNLPSIIRQP